MGGALMNGNGWETYLLVVLGVVVLASGVLPLLRPFAGMGSGALMEFLGVVMILSSYLLPMMVLAASFGMEIVGALMILNGVMMQRPGRVRMK